MLNSAEFQHTMRSGVRAGRQTVVIHIRPAEPGDGPCRVGFVVSKQVGCAVVRNRVKRRLRHLMRPLIEQPDAVGGVVVRALPAAATAQDDLASDLRDAYHQAVRRL